MQKIYLNVVLTVLILTFSFFTGTLLAQTPGSVFHQAEDIKSGTFGSNVGEGNYVFPANIDANNQITAGTKLKVGASEFTSSSGNIGGNLTVTGNVGIGTTSPGAKLDVRGNVQIPNSDTTLSFGSDTRQMINLWSTSYGIGVQGWTQYFRTDADFQFYKGGVHSDVRGDPGTGGTALLTIKDTGNVGIGTTSPSQKLHIAGTARVDGAIVAPEGTLRDDGGGWVRTYGQTGWYSQTYGGGWYMTDSTYLRPYNNKQILASGGINMNNTKITNLAAPTADSDAATRGWVLANTGGMLFEIQGKRSDNGVWEKIDDFGYWGPNGPKNPYNDEYTLSNEKVYKNGSLIKSSSASYSYPTVGGYAPYCSNEAGRQYCLSCHGYSDARVDACSSVAATSCTSIGAGCSCGATGGQPWTAAITCYNGGYRGLRVR